jgi:hypothetical protein
MAIIDADRFVRFPTRSMEAFLSLPLNGTQWRIVLWIIRNTLGWNRSSIPFRWYRLAKELV